jgi:hypothetical protein
VKGWRLVASLIAEGVSAGEFRPDLDAEVAARVVMTGLLGQIILQQHAGIVPALGIDNDRLIDSTVEFLLAALRPVETRPRHRPGGPGQRRRRGEAR